MPLSARGAGGPVVHSNPCLLCVFGRGAGAGDAADRARFPSMSAKHVPLDPGKVPDTATPVFPGGAWLDASGGHRVWWCEGGDPQGLPVLLVHGGPGGRSRPESLRWWRGLGIRWIAIDQRGCGRSQPTGGCADNRLDDLLDDMDRLRQQLGLRRWSIAAGSWGATVALASWLREPTAVDGLFLRSPFLGSHDEVARYLAPWRGWLGRQGCERLGPDVERLERWLLAPSGREAAIDGAGLGAGAGLDADAPQDEARLAEAWGGFDDAQSQAGGVAAAGREWQPAVQAPAVAPAWRLFTHYARHGWFLRRPLLEALGDALPARRPRALSIVGGAADHCCDPALVTVLAERLAPARARLVPGGGHRADAPPMAAALEQAARDWVADLGA